MEHNHERDREVPCFYGSEIGTILYVVADSFRPSRCSESKKIYPRIPTTDIAKLLRYSGSRVEHRDGFYS